LRNVKRDFDKVWYRGLRWESFPFRKDCLWVLCLFCAARFALFAGGDYGGGDVVGRSLRGFMVFHGVFFTSEEETNGYQRISRLGHMKQWWSEFVIARNEVTKQSHQKRLLRPYGARNDTKKSHVTQSADFLITVLKCY